MRSLLARADALGRRHPWRLAALAAGVWIVGLVAFPLVALLPASLFVYWVAASRLSPPAGPAGRASTWGLVLAGALVWVAVGAGTATAVSVLAIFTWAFLIFHYAAPAAAVLGAIQGGWIAVEGRRDAAPACWTGRCGGRSSASWASSRSSPPPAELRPGGEPGCSSRPLCSAAPRRRIARHRS